MVSGGQKNDGGANIWKLQLSVSHFGDYKSNEIGVRLIEGQDQVEITGKQNWRPHPGGSVRKEFAQRHVLPADIDKDKLNAYMTKDGLLVIKAPRLILTSGNRANPLNHWNALNQVLGRQPVDMPRFVGATVPVIGHRHDSLGPFAGKSPLDFQRPVSVPLPPKPRSIHKDLLFRDVTGIYPAD